MEVVQAAVLHLGDNSISYLNSIKPSSYKCLWHSGKRAIATLISFGVWYIVNELSLKLVIG